MAIKTAAVTATTTAAALTASDTDDLRGQGWALKNTGGTNTVYVGGSDVTSSIGVPIAPGEWFAWDTASSGDTPWVVTSTGSTTVVVFRTGA